MNTATLITFIVGAIIPAAVALVTRASMPLQVREAILLLLSTASGIISGLATSPPVGVSQWEHVLINIFVTFVTAEASSLAGNKTGITPAVHEATDHRFGLGTYDPNLAAVEAA
jgi:hypothetical protein